MSAKISHSRTNWFIHDRFGMFIHWGLYALAARHEWVKQREETPDALYDSYLKYFNPDLYDPAAWAQTIADAGMKYCVITAKHHEGFCLWDSKLTDYKATKTPAKRDLLRPFVEELRKRDIRVGFYYSLIDWHHEDFVIDDLHPLRNSPDREKLNKKRDQTRYIKYLHAQVKELLTQFGTIDILWLDYSYPTRKLEDGTIRIGKGKDDWDSLKLLKMVRTLQPHIIVNDRLDIEDGWDIKTPEQFQPRQWVKVNGRPVVWEACQTFSGSWGYFRDEESWKSNEQLVQMLIDTVSKGGNLLLNVGPTARGQFDCRAMERLTSIGRWMKQHSRSIYGCTQAPEEFTSPQDCRLTYNPKTKRMYVHVFAWPFVQLHLDGFKDKVAYAQLLHDSSEVKMNLPIGFNNTDTSADKNTLTLHLPVKKPDVIVPVVELFLK